MVDLHFPNANTRATAKADVRLGLRVSSKTLCRASRNRVSTRPAPAAPRVGVPVWER